MNLYRVFNGYTGFTDVSLMATAESEERAIQIAKPVFKNADNREGYSTNLKAELVFCDCSIEHCSEPKDS